MALTLQQIATAAEMGNQSIKPLAAELKALMGVTRRAKPRGCEEFSARYPSMKSHIEALRSLGWMSDRTITFVVADMYGLPAKRKRIGKLVRSVRVQS